MDPDRLVADDVESNALAPAQGTAPTTSRPNDSKFVRTNLAASQPPPSQIPVVPQVVDTN
ncbi:ruBisCO large subunit-binding protein subunit alpha, chloroplastic-like [Gossypium australe]|uniref:RuBisCO large subunit-binding protein subunit alpha, chloroplastic-like n=1 Tax=Gossypium australe TaxID=47621 RepID=A0A5B6VX69_9ROSI|nr:ruBisCO large subunit-binding protein subunit alpha, chloroplastic-like [Gossypium australe]